VHNAATRVIDHFLRLQRTLAIETRQFQDLSHNDDLCPRMQRQIETVLTATGKFEPVVYDTQGFLDQGADIVVRVRHQERLDHEPPELLGFQIKSFGDFRGRDLFRTLKAQRDDALRKIVGLSTYYLLLCTDEDRDKDAIRNIEAEFKSADRTIIIEPTYAMGFLRLTDRRIEGVVTRLHHAHDLVFRLALDSVTDLGSATAGILAVYLAASEAERHGEISEGELRNRRVLEDRYLSTLEARRALSERYAEVIERDEEPRAAQERIRRKQGPTEADVKRMSEVFFDNFADALAYDIDALDTHLIDVDSSSGRIAVRRDDMLPLIALLTDAQVRYQLAADQLFLYGVESLGLLE
jgi:hypothetical protein